MTKLTKRKQAWVDRRKPDVINGPTINPNASIAARYNEKLDALIKKMTEETERKLRRLFNGETAEEYFAEDASMSSQARILMNALLKKFNKAFTEASKPYAEAFANQSNAASSSAVHSSIKELSGGLSLPTANLYGDLKDVLNATVAENVQLIKSIPQKYLNAVQGAVMRSITTGTGQEDLMPFLMKYKGVTYKRARFIAIDQTRKAMTNMSKNRLENLGFKQFRWRHTGGSDHPRELHVRMNGEIYDFDNPPVIDEKTGERGFPGQAPGCRCKMQMVISFDKKTDRAS